MYEHDKIIDKKDILMKYLIMNNKYDMANAVDKYCDDTHGIIFNKHPAKSEENFTDIYEHSVSLNPSINSLDQTIKKSLEKISQGTQNTFKSLKSLINEELNNSKNVSKETLNNSKNINKETLKNSKNVSKETIHDSKSNNNKSFNNITNDNKEINENKNIYKNEDDEHINSKYDIITNHGKGKFLRFIGNNYMYVILQDGTLNCFPVSLVKYNTDYLKKNPAFTLNINHNKMFVNHTKKLLEAKKNPLCTIKQNNKENELENKFVNFSCEKISLKNFIMNEEKTNNDTIDKKDLINIYLKNKKDNNENDKFDLDNFTYDLFKKNVNVKDLYNEYKFEGCGAYKTIDEQIIEETENCNACC